MKYPHKLIISLMYGGGLRISECLSLRVQNFNFDMKILTIHDGKGQKDRTVPIPEVLMGELKAQLDLVIEQHEKDCQAGFDGVFLYGQSLQKALRKAVKKAKIPKRVTSHTFRHSFASHLLQANYDIRTIQELLGHSDVRTTMIYTHTVKSVTIKEAKSPLDF
jgi:integrase